MKITYSSPLNGRAGGFTLLELLVVIAIIGILAGLMFPATTGALRKAEKTHAENTAYNLKNALTSYFTEYRKHPVQGGSGEGDEVLRTNNELMDAILGGDSERAQELNPRKIAFYSGRPAKPKGGGKYIKGIRLESDGGGELWDPWGDYYFVSLDTDYNNRIQKPSWDTTNSSTVLPESVLIWSGGKDNDENSRDDNIKTW